MFVNNLRKCVYLFLAGILLFLVLKPTGVYAAAQPYEARQKMLMSSMAQVYYLLPDERQQITYVTDSSGEIVTLMAYDAWGHQHYIDRQPTSLPLTIYHGLGHRLGTADHLRHVPSGRACHQMLNRCLQRDTDDGSFPGLYPVGIGGGLSWHRTIWTWNNPNLTDASGYNPAIGGFFGRLWRGARQLGGRIVNIPFYLINKVLAPGEEYIQCEDGTYRDSQKFGERSFTYERTYEPPSGLGKDPILTGEKYTIQGGTRESSCKKPVPPRPPSRPPATSPPAVSPAPSPLPSPSPPAIPIGCRMPYKHTTGETVFPIGDPGICSQEHHREPFFGPTPDSFRKAGEDAEGNPILICFRDGKVVDCQANRPLDGRDYLEGGEPRLFSKDYLFTRAQTYS